MDPPWPSKSVARAKPYGTLPTAGAQREVQRFGAPSAVVPLVAAAEAGAPAGAAAGAAAGEAAAGGAGGGGGGGGGGGAAAAAAEVAALVRLRVGRLADRERGCLVGVWVTNRRALVNAVQHCFLPSLGAIPLSAHDCNANDDDGGGGDNIYGDWASRSDGVGETSTTGDGDGIGGLDGSVLYWLKVSKSHAITDVGPFYRPLGCAHLSARCVLVAGGGERRARVSVGAQRGRRVRGPAAL
jgi:hypothetical protein